MKKALLACLASATILTSSPSAGQTNTDQSNATLSIAVPGSEQTTDQTRSWVVGLVYGQSLSGEDYSQGKGVAMTGISLRRGRMLSKAKRPCYEFLYGANFSLSNRGYFAGIDAVIAAHYKAQGKAVVSPSLGFGVQINDMYTRVNQRAIG